MKTPRLQSLLITGGLSLALLSPVFAGDHDKDDFKSIDTNSDGRVTASEHSAFSATMFTQSDSNGDGKVSAAEWDAAAKAARPDVKMDPQETAAHLKIMDKDGDGHVSRTESEAFATAAFAKADKDADGSLTEKEFKAAKKDMKKEKKQHS